MSLLVYSENRELAYQLLGKAAELAKKMDSMVYCLAEDEPEVYLSYGANKVLLAELGEKTVEPLRDALIEAVEISGAEIVLLGATKLGRELAPRVAATLGVGCLNECNKVDYVDGEIIVERLTYGGSTIAKEKSTSTPTIITASPKSFGKYETEHKEGEVIQLEYQIPDTKVKVLERNEKPKGDQDLENADIIVSAGRGFKNKDDLKMLEALAEVLGGAALGCTRPISADLGWMEEWVGISGKKIKPSLYITCGVSGQIQHVAGIRDSKVIVSINSDESAGIHGVSDYSVVGDIYEVVPALVEALKEKA